MDWLSVYGPSIFWLVALVIFLVVEGLTVGLTSVWFAAGALAALITSFAIHNIWLEIVSFLVVSFLALLCVRPIACRFMVPKQQPTNADRVIGTEAIVLEEIDNLKACGQVSVGGVIWTARAQDNHPIAKDARVRILRIEGVKLIVTPAEESAHVPEIKEEE